jgi:hypothetical protein
MWAEPDEEDNLEKTPARELLNLELSTQGELAIEQAGEDEQQLILIC